MECDRVSKEYLDGVEEFLDHAFHQSNGESIPCPCKKCVLHYVVNRAVAYDHLVVNGIIPSYDTWFCHGESLNLPTCIQETNCREEASRGDDMVGMIHDVFGGFTQLMDNSITERDDVEPNLEENITHSSRNQSHPEVEKFE